MNNGRHDQCLLEESDSRDEVGDAMIEGNVIVADVNISDESDHDSTSSHPSSRSYNNHWPQSFRYALSTMPLSCQGT